MSHVFRIRVLGLQLMLATAATGLFGQQAWQLSWDEFLKAYQACLNDRSCDANQFFDKNVTWQGTFTGLSSDGNYYQTQMTPGTMTDRNNKTVPVNNILLHQPANPDAWRALKVGDIAKFQASLPNGYTGFFGGFVFQITTGPGSTLVTGTTPPAISSVVNGASFQPGIVPNSWVTIQGTNLATTTDTWDKSIVAGNLPTTLDGVSVSVDGKAAYVYYISPGQINAIVPDVSGGNVAVTVTNSNGTNAPVNATSRLPGWPGFFLWVGKYAVATRQDFSWAVKSGTFQGVTTTPAKPGDVIILWGTGFGPTTPAAPFGAQIPADKTYLTTNAVSVTVGGLPAQVYGTAMAPGFAGLYQVAIQIPPAAPDGDLPVIATVSSTQSPSSVLITVQH